MKMSIGIDVSKDKLDVSIYDGINYKYYQFDNSRKGIEQLLNETNQFNHEAVFTMEATGVYSLLASNMLYERKYSVSVVNPLIIKRYSEYKMCRAKTDKIDSRIIADYGFNNPPSCFIPKPIEMQYLKQYLKLVYDFKQEITRYTNRLKALKINPKVNNSLLQLYNEHVLYLKNKIKQAENEIDKIISENFKKENELLRSIPGVGKRISAIIISNFHTFEDFENSKQLSSMLGINPSPYKSGSSVNRRAVISRKGNSYIRKILYMGALVASKNNKECREFYNRLLLKGKDKKLALIAVENKLLRQIFTVLKNKREYIENYYFNNQKIA